MSIPAKLYRPFYHPQHHYTTYPNGYFTQAMANWVNTNTFKMNVTHHGENFWGVIETLSCRGSRLYFENVFYKSAVFRKGKRRHTMQREALNSSTVSSQLVKDTISAINLVGGKVDRLEISWIKAHVGHIGNERADQLARDCLLYTSPSPRDS